MKKVLSLFLSAIVLLSCFTLSAVSAAAAEKPVPGYYVVGTFNNWTIGKAYRMEPAYFDNHYALYQTPLDAGDALKIVYSEDGLRASTWYPAGVDNNYVVTESNQYYNIEVAPDYDGAGDGWYCSCIKAQPCPPPIDDPTEPEHIDYTKKLWETGEPLTAEDIEEAANELYRSRTYFYADDIVIADSYRFESEPAFAVTFSVKDYAYYDVMLEEQIGDWLLYTSMPEPYVFAGDKLYRIKEAYEADILTDAMLAELAASSFTGGNSYRILTEYIKGDADGDGDVNIVDATFVQRYDVEILGEHDIFKPLADVDGDSWVDIVDATLIQRCELGLYTIAG